ncbi:MCE family protein, partial [Tsukamurella paurometabola]
MYAGSDVRILGVKVGEIDEVSPERDRVRVQLHVDRGVQLPQDLWAAQVTPSVISDRYVQLLPVYSDGPTAQSGAVVAEDHTMTPVEIDQVYASVSTLAQALGPEGANKRGALTEVLDASSQNLAGNGQAMADAIAGLSKAATTLSDSRDNIAATVKGLNTFVTMLAENDKQVRVFNTQLADLTGYLAGERDDFTKALNLLASALGDVGAFVRDNRDALTSNVNGLTEITKIPRQPDRTGRSCRTFRSRPVTCSRPTTVTPGRSRCARTFPICKIRSERSARWPISASRCPGTPEA